MAVPGADSLRHELVVPATAVAAIERITLHRVRLPLLEPFAAAHGTEHHREVVLVEVTGTDGETGWGECVALSQPTYTSEYTAGAWSVLRNVLVPGVLAGLALDVRACPMAWTAISGALQDLALRRRGVSLSSSIGGDRRRVACTAVIGGQADPAALVARVAARRAEGYGAVKVKIAPGADLDRLRPVRERFPELALAADANGSYRVDDAGHRVALEAIDALGLTYLEQPLAPGAPDDLIRLASRAATPIALDESIEGPDDVARFAASGASFVVNVKPGRVGGLDRAVACVERASAAGWPAFVGGMLETGVGRALALAAASLPGCTLPTDLGPSTRYFADDVTEPFVLVQGGLVVPSGPGLGVAPRPDRLAGTTVDRHEARR